ncbi:hypothetical protein SAMN05660649_00018 [Desulfotomaculum arcticum]|uniref:Uncharacterized protein n=1 Tax=Desulfotruncus arcticus DSM 17038 TaxID=1121424 RepID=A0A1I2MTP8_9FIRM|nr:hypothetical protein SAMN05660649_00018 [Desulfotomaculum arcticum] [Desulfotruncus arcticus DSM 17038]
MSCNFNGFRFSPVILSSLCVVSHNEERMSVFNLCGHLVMLFRESRIYRNFVHFYLTVTIWIYRCGETAVPEKRKPPVRNWETAINMGYKCSCAAKPQFRCGVSRLCGTTGPPPFSYSLSILSKPYTSRIEMSLDGSMLSILILYAS